uniref:Allatostatin C n=1 Tax=Glossina pallidipes TaxID=7398 RepID=A0A1B0A0M1_GLOPL
MSRITMVKLLHNIVFACFFLLIAAINNINARPETTEAYQSWDNVDFDVDDIRKSYYDVPLDRLQMLAAQYRPMSYWRVPSYDVMNELLRLPKTKREAKYKQCYFNPISCFRK